MLTKTAHITPGELATAGPTVALWPTAAHAVGVSKSHAYTLARRGEFPVQVLKLGGTYRVVTSELLTLLGIERPHMDGAA